MLPEEIFKEIKWEPIHKPVVGGQQCGHVPAGCRLIHEMSDFEVAIGYSKSQLKNKEVALLMFEVYLDHIKNIR